MCVVCNVGVRWKPGEAFCLPKWTSGDGWPERNNESGNGQHIAKTRKTNMTVWPYVHDPVDNVIKSRTLADWNFDNFPYHTQEAERCVKMETEASQKTLVPSPGMGLSLIHIFFHSI